MNSQDYDNWKLDNGDEDDHVNADHKELDLNSIQVDGIDTKDYPDFCDAYCCSAQWTDGTPLTDSEIDENVTDDLIYDAVIKKLF
jgi:hypothetical protein